MMMKRRICLAAVMLLCPVVLASSTHDERPLPLEGVKTLVDLTDYWGRAVPVPEIIDGDEEKGWSSKARDLTPAPSNLFLTFPQPVTVGTVEVLTVTSRGNPVLSELAVYARVGDGWASLGEVKENREERLRLALRPATVVQLRLRVRADASAIQVREIRLYAPPPGDRPVALHAAAVPGETPSEHAFVVEALGLRKPEPTTTYDPSVGYVGYARAFADTMISDGTDRYGKDHSPQLVSLLEIATHHHPNMLLPCIPGQRMHDRAYYGGNLQHDIMLLRAFESLSDLTGEDRYRRASRAYIGFFLEKCTGTPTGLWPWGEHTNWDFYKEAIDKQNHEYLGLPPLAFWERAWEMHPNAVCGEADGLLNHVTNLDAFAFNRHAVISDVLPDPRPKRLLDFLLDFPRHGGMYVTVWAFAYSKTHDSKYLNWCERMLDHFEETRLKDGFLPVLSQYSYRPLLQPSPESNLSVGLSLLETAPLLGDAPLAARLRELGAAYLARVAERPQDVPAKAGFAAGYGTGDFSGGAGLMRAHAFRLTHDRRQLEAAKAMAHAYAAVDPIPTADHTRADVYGTLVNLMLDMYDLDGGDEWLPAAERIARRAIEVLYCNGLFRGSVDSWYYDSELGVSTLVYGLLRLHTALQRGRSSMAPYTFTR